MSQSDGDRWQPWWTDLLFVVALLTATTANLLVPLLLWGVRHLMNPSARAAQGYGLQLVLPFLDRGGVVVAGVGLLAAITVAAYVVQRRRGLVVANQFVAWMWLLGFGLTPTTWAMVLLGVGR